MPKKLKFEPNQQPRNITEIGKGYIQEFYAYGVSNGTITKEQLDSWITFVEGEEQSDKSPMKKFAAIRAEFVKRHYPQLRKKDNPSQMSDYFKSLKK